MRLSGTYSRSNTLRERLLIVQAVIPVFWLLLGESGTRGNHIRTIGITELIIPHLCGHPCFLLEALDCIFLLFTEFFVEVVTTEDDALRLVGNEATLLLAGWTRLVCAWILEL